MHNLYIESTHGSLKNIYLYRILIDKFKVRILLSTYLLLFILVAFLLFHIVLFYQMHFLFHFVLQSKMFFIISRAFAISEHFINCPIVAK